MAVSARRTKKSTSHPAKNRSKPQTAGAKRPQALISDEVTAPPTGGPSPGEMGTGPEAPAAIPALPGSHADVRSLPLRPETLSPTAPPPEPPVLERGLKRGKRAALPPQVRLTTPAPSIALLQRKVAELMALQGAHPDQDLVGDMILTALRMIRDETTRGELKILAATLRELRYAFNIFRPFRATRKVTVFGSARTSPEAGEYIQAMKFSAELARRGFMIISGAGGGIMEAANGGAGREKSFGVNIKLPFEQSANRYIEGDRKLIQFRYFFTRKLCFIKEASAIALFPGGFGTHDECFETLTLIQTGKAAMIPVVFIDKPGGTYWREWADYVVEHLLGKGLICEEDMSLFKITDDAHWAADEITNFYKRYHSSRFVRDVLVVRMLSKLPKGTLERFNDQFRSLTATGNERIFETGPLPEEAGEPELAALPRIAMPFNRRNYGRLRLLIDEINHA